MFFFQGHPINSLVKRHFFGLSGHLQNQFLLSNQCSNAAGLLCSIEYFFVRLWPKKMPSI
jgi:hypothetical protein